MAKESKRRTFLSFLAWWRTDPAEIERQVAQYDSLRVWQSARGISLLLCALSVTITALLGATIMKLSAGEIITEAVVWAIIGLLMYKAQKWAFIAAMLLWTFEKAYLVYTGVSSGSPPIAQVFWWAAYMNAFMLGFRTESARKRRAAVVVASV